MKSRTGGKELSTPFYFGLSCRLGPSRPQPVRSRVQEDRRHELEPTGNLCGPLGKVVRQSGPVRVV